MTVKELDGENFGDNIENGTWIVDFFAPWCGPCKELKPEFEDAAQEFNDVNFGIVNIGEEQELANSYSIRSVPTLVKIVDGTVKDQKMGYLEKEDILDWASN